MMASLNLIPGQLHAVEENEIKQIREAYRAVGGTEYEERMKWAFVIVTKRINVRMFARQGKEVGASVYARLFSSLTLLAFVTSLSSSSSSFTSFFVLIRL